MHANGLRRCEAVSFNKIYVNISALLVLISKCDLCKFLIMSFCPVCNTFQGSFTVYSSIFLFWFLLFIVCMLCGVLFVVCVCVCMLKFV